MYRLFGNASNRQYRSACRFLPTGAHHGVGILAPRLFLLIALGSSATFAANVGPAVSIAIKAAPLLDRAPAVHLDLHGHVRAYVDAVTENWLLRAPDDNPAMLGMFRDRERQPYRDLLPWSGEFAGKYLTASTEVLRLTGEPRLRVRLEGFVREFISLQDADGYLGPFPKGSHLTGKAPNSNGTWDAWGHYHTMLGLLRWHELTGDAAALQCARRIGDLLCLTFLPADKRVVDTGSAEMNQAIAHGMALLYRATGEQRYLDLAQKVVNEFAANGAGDYLQRALAGKAFYQTAKPRWESLHPILGLIELHRATGNPEYRKAFEQLWWSIVEFDRHNNGGFSSGEQATGNPYDRGAIETCCTIAWTAMSVEMLRTTGNSVVADELELSTLNQIVGLYSPTGAWCTYNTPMDGGRRPSGVDIAFQKRPGSEGLSCCSVNAARGFGLIADWALMSENDGRALVVNWYGPSTMTAALAGTTVQLKQTTDYPRQGRVTLKITPEKSTAFTLKLRVPHWSAQTAIAVNGQPVAAERVKAGTYCAIEREWKVGDEVVIDLDLSLHVWAGERECAGQTSVYRGPILLAYDFGKPAAARFAPEAPWKRFDDLWACDQPGASLETTFEGDGIKWFGYRFDDAGRAKVEIDGKLVDTVDQYAPQRGVPFTWERRDPALGAGRHTIRLTILDAKDNRSKGKWINLTGFGKPGAPAPGIDPLPTLTARSLNASKVVENRGSDGDQPWLTLQLTSDDGREVQLIDYASAGQNGSRYASWLTVTGVPATPFSRATPLRSARLK